MGIQNVIHKKGFSNARCFVSLQIQGHRGHLVRCQGEETLGRARGVVVPAHKICQIGVGILGVRICLGGAKDLAL